MSAPEPPIRVVDVEAAMSILASALQGIPERPGFDPGTVDYVVPRNRRDAVEEAVHAILKLGARSTFDEAIRAARADERAKLRSAVLRAFTSPTE